MRVRSNCRRGITSMQWIVVAALVVLAVFAGVQLVGQGTKSKMSQTGSDLANPVNLTKHMGS
jgi:negative regulator of sigma E activity